MKQGYRVLLLPAIALVGVILVLVSVNGQVIAAEQTKATWPSANNRDKASQLQGPYQGKEIIIARDTEEGSVVNVRWCGPTALAYQYGDPEPTDSPPESHGIYWVDLAKPKPQKLKLEKNAVLVDCPQDGKWIVYILLNKGGKRDEAYWRYNLKTRERQKFALRAYYGGLSPDGNKLLLRRTKIANTIKMPEPRWEVVWLQKDYPTNGFEAVWMADSKRVVVKYQADLREQSPMRLGLEMHDVAKPRFVELKTNIELGRIEVDNTNRIYGFIEKRLPSPMRVMKTSRKLARCEIVDDSLRCEEIFPGREDIFPYNVSRDGNTLVFREEGNNCVWLYKIQSGKKECVVDGSMRPGFWISPDGKWLAFHMYERSHPSRVTYLMGRTVVVVKLTD